MKKFSKSTAIILSIVFCIALVVGAILSFVPLKFGSKTFVSFSRSINVSTDLVGGMYGEYDILTENPSDSSVIDSITIIRDVFEEDGYKNVSVYSVGKSKVRVELSYPNGDETFASTYSKLSNVGQGAFSIRSTNELEDDSIVLDGKEGISGVTVAAGNETKYITIKFNEIGKEKLKKLCENSSTVYLVLGEYSQSLTISSIDDYSQLTLSNTDWKNMISLEQRIKLGCTKIELDGTNARINTLSANLSSGESSSSPSNESFFSSTVFVVSVSAFLAIVIMSLAFFVVKYGFYAVLALITMLFNTYLFLIFANLVPSFELGLSVIFTLVIGFAYIYLSVYEFARIVKKEYNLGKSLSAALESSYKKSLYTNIITGISIFVASLILMGFSFSELTSVSVCLAIISVLSMLTNLLFVPLFVKIGISFGNFGRKLFMLKKRSSFAEVDENNSKGDK